MEPVTAVFLAFLMFVGVGQEQKIVELTEQNEVLAEEIQNLNADYLKLGSMHAAHAARSNTIDDKHDRTLDSIVDEIEELKAKDQYLDKKIGIFHE